MLDDERSSFAGLPLKDCSLNDFFDLLDVAFPARCLEKLSVCRARDPNIVYGTTSPAPRESRPADAVSL